MMKGSGWWRRTPRVFLSYAREDSESASVIYESLGKIGCYVFMDTESTYVGERFEAVILANLRESAFVPLYSPAFVASDWCRAELHAAHSLDIDVFPACLGDPLALVWPEPLVKFTHECQRVPVGNDRHALATAIQKRLRHVGRRKRARWIAALSTAAIMLTTLGFGLNALVQRMLAEQERTQVLNQVRASSMIYPKKYVDDLAKRLPRDADTRGALAVVQTDSQLSDAVRTNAKILSSALRSESNRWFIRELRCAEAEIKDASFVDVTFFSGSVRASILRNVSFANVVWASAFGLSAVTFERCRFAGGEFVRDTKVIDTKFVSCFFRGVTLELVGFGAAEFRSRASDNPRLIADGLVCAFENSVIANSVAAPAPGVMDFGGPESEVCFVGVVFFNCRFTGFIRPTWFENCTFSHCILPQALSVEALAKNNLVQNPLASAEN